MLELKVRLKRGSFELDVALAVPRASVTVLVGESGSGKTTLLRLVAGLIAPDRGTIALDGRVLVDKAAGVFVAPEDRPVGLVAQDYALFPHLTVRENVAFGLRETKASSREARRQAGEALDRFGIADLAERMPGRLSGGQQQRVAIARALVLEPKVLLLDEPLSALDVATRRGVRSELRRVLEDSKCATLYVTHHPVEALGFGQQVAVLEAGRVSQVGSRAEFVRHPRSAYVAEFLGVNLIEGEVREPGSEGLARLEVEGGALWIPDPGRLGAVRCVVHPHDVFLSTTPSSGSARNLLRGVVEEMVPEPPSGDCIRVLLATRPPIAAQITHAAAEALGLAPGTEVFASFKATAVEVAPP